MFQKHKTLLSILFATASAALAQPTYSREVSRIMEQKCQICHRPNNVAPFALMSYEDASTWAEDIKRVVSERIMPPWKPVAGHGDFRDSFALTDEERRTLLDWVAAGAPEGDKGDLPEPKPPTGEWANGEPDIVLKMAESYTPQRGKDTYRCFVVSNPLEQTLYVKAADVLPGNRRIVHHVILFIDERGMSPSLDAAEEGPGYTCFGGPRFPVGLNSAVAGWAPGSMPRELPEGIAVEVPKGARIVMQVHYYASGLTGEDQTRVGIYLSKTPAEKRIYFVPVINARFEIPPGDENHEVRASFMVPLDAKVYQIFPHMHLLGKKIKVDLENLRRELTPLIYIDDWDFNWQGFYNYKEPIRLPALNTLRLTCNFDNSANNPRNPSNPLKPVRFGEGTEDEMCLAFLGVTFDNDDLLRLLRLQPAQLNP